VFLGHSRFDLPVEVESVQGLNGSIIDFANIADYLTDLLLYLRLAGRFFNFLWFLDDSSNSNRLYNNNWLCFHLISFRMRN
jgi:hypothetical protein